MLHFRTQETSIVCTTASAALVGELIDGRPFEASDSIRTVRGMSSAREVRPHETRRRGGVDAAATVTGVGRSRSTRHLYLHGFGSGPLSTKGVCLRDAPELFGLDG